VILVGWFQFHWEVADNPGMEGIHVIHQYNAIQHIISQALMGVPVYAVMVQIDAPKFLPPPNGGGFS
jgi:hypothetical protein